MSDRVELLAPAGDWPAFLAAVENGADAVYLGGKLFNARQSASNFGPDELKKALDYAHIRDVRLYLTLNTLISDIEMPEALNFAEKAYLSGIDGIIVQDLGLAGMLNRYLPGLDLHASTQMTIYSRDGAALLKKQGFKRIVLARELSIDEIRDIADNAGIEVEVFAHGALCICYSGQCLMSSMIGGRSGNRGRCAQPCRMKYELYSAAPKALEKPHAEGANYLLSPKDLCSLGVLRELTEAGVRSLKIEGRMKSPEYVAIVVGIYRKHLDAIYNGTDISGSMLEEDTKTLMQIFNRGGFSSGYLKGKTGRTMMSWEKPKNWGLYLGNAASYDKYDKTVTVRLKERISIGDGIEVWNGENESPGTIVTSIKIGNKSLPSAEAGETAVLGSINGKIDRGNMVYKTSDKSLNNSVKETFSGRYSRKVELDAEVKLEKGRPVILKLNDNRGNIVTAIGDTPCEAAVHTPLTEERLRTQLIKTGATPFNIRNLAVSIEEGLSLPVSELNNVRRKAVEDMEQARVRLEDRGQYREIGAMARTDSAAKAGSTVKIGSVMKAGPVQKAGTPQQLRYSLYFYDIDSIYATKDDSGATHNIDRTFGADRLYLPFKAFLSDRSKNTDLISKLKAEKAELFIAIPSVTRGSYERLIKSRIEELLGLGIDGVSAGNPGMLEYLSRFNGLRIIADYSLNVFNSCTSLELAQLGADEITLSPELTLSQISELGAAVRREMIGYGRIALMTSEYCPAGSVYGSFTDCSKCSRPCTRSDFYIKDRMGMTFPVKCDNIDCRSIIFNSNVLFIPESLERLRQSGINTIRLNITDEKPELIRELVRLYRTAADSFDEASSKYSGLIASIKEKGFTKGHLYRGV